MYRLEGRLNKGWVEWWKLKQFHQKAALSSWLVNVVHGEKTGPKTCNTTVNKLFNILWYTLIFLSIDYSSNWQIISALPWIRLAACVAERVCRVSICLRVPLTPQNSLQVELLEVLDERPQTADHWALQGYYSWQRARAWRTQTHKHDTFSTDKNTAMSHRPDSSEASSALQLTVCLVLSESRWGICREVGV